MGLVAAPGIVPRLASSLWPSPRRPYQDFGLNADDIAQPQLRHAGAQPRVSAIGGVHQYDPARQAGLARPLDLIERDRRLGLELDLRRHARLLPACAILGPSLRQVQPIGDRKAGGMIGNRQRYRHLAIGLLAQLTAILVVHADRMLALLRERRV